MELIGPEIAPAQAGYREHPRRSVGVDPAVCRLAEGRSRVAARGDVVGGATLLSQLNSPETTIALTSIRAFEAGPQQFRELIRDRSIRRRLATINGSRPPTRRRSSAEASAAR